MKKLERFFLTVVPLRWNNSEQWRYLSASFLTNGIVPQYHSLDTNVPPLNLTHEPLRFNLLLINLKHCAIYNFFFNSVFLFLLKK